MCLEAAPLKAVCSADSFLLPQIREIGASTNVRVQRNGAAVLSTAICPIER